MVHEIADQPQLQGVEMGDVAAIVQVKALRGICGVEFGDLCLRGPWRLEMGTYIVRERSRVVLRIHCAIDGGETRRVLLGVVGQEFERLLGRLATVFGIKTPEKYLPFTIRKTFQIELPLRSFFQAPTVARIAEVVTQMQAGGAGVHMSALRARSREAHRVSSTLPVQGSAGSHN